MTGFWSREMKLFLSRRGDNVSEQVKKMACSAIILIFFIKK